jgi:hypothetical protein
LRERRGTVETTVRIFFGGLKGFSVEDRLDRTERACLSSPDWTAPRDAVVREGAGFQGAVDLCRKAGRFLSSDRLKMSRKETVTGEA